jgi:hypothetical protein
MISGVIPTAENKKAALQRGTNDLSGKAHHRSRVRRLALVRRFLADRQVMTRLMRRTPLGVNGVRDCRPGPS